MSLINYIVRRILLLTLVLVGVSLVVFSIMMLIPPGQRVAVYVRTDRVTPAQLENLIVKYGLRDPAPLQYLRWIRNIFSGDFGFSITAANTDTQSGITLGECPAGNGPDTINLDPGIYTLAISGPPDDGNAAGDLDITSDLTIAGAGTASTIIQAGSTAPTGIDRVIHVVGPDVTVLLDDLTLRNGNETATGLGGAVKIEDTNVVSILDCSISGNRTLLSGGGIYNVGVLNILNSTISNNRAASGGGIVNAFPSGLLNIANSSVSGNSSNLPSGWEPINRHKLLSSRPI